MVIINPPLQHEQKQHHESTHRRQNSGTPKLYFFVLLVAALVSALFVFLGPHVDGYIEQQHGTEPYPHRTKIFADIDSSIFHFDYKPTCPPQWLPYNHSNEMHPSSLLLYTNLTKVLDSNQIPHALTAGTLLALERSNYTKLFMPWDDDFDIVVDTSLEELIKVLESHPILDNQRPKHNTDYGRYLKLAYKDRGLQSGVSNSSLTSLGSYDYPAIDVFLKSNWKNRNMGPMHFPTKQVKVGKYSLSIPESPHLVLDRRFGKGVKGWRSTCVSLKWNHGAGYSQKYITTKCESVFAQCGYTDFHTL